MTDRDELADRLDAVEDAIDTTSEPFDCEPLTPDEKRELAEVVDPDGDGDLDLADLQETADELF